MGTTQIVQEPVVRTVAQVHSEAQCTRNRQLGVLRPADVIFTPDSALGGSTRGGSWLSPTSCLAATWQISHLSNGEILIDISLTSSGAPGLEVA